MIAVVQRVLKSTVETNGRMVGKISGGLLVLLGVSRGDSEADVSYLADKIVNLRIFEDDDGKMNRSLMETGQEMLVVSQFTLLGDCRKGRRPSFIEAADPHEANTLYESFVASTRSKGIRVQTGTFGALMDVALINNGPVTLIVRSPSAKS